MKIDNRLTYFHKLTNGEVTQGQRAASLQDTVSESLYVASGASSARSQPTAMASYGAAQHLRSTTCRTVVTGNTVGQRIDSVAPAATGAGLDWIGCDTGEKTALLIDTSLNEMPTETSSSLAVYWALRVHCFSTRSSC